MYPALGRHIIIVSARGVTVIKCHGSPIPADVFESLMSARYVTEIDSPIMLGARLYVITPAGLRAYRENRYKGNKTALY